MPCTFLHILLGFLLIVCSSVRGSAQDIAKYYVASHIGTGILYYILPQDGFCNSTHKSEMVYDITYKTTLDTATINFSYVDQTLLNIDSLRLIYGEQTHTSKANKMFIETKGRKWYYRYSARIHINDLSAFFNTDIPPSMVIVAQQQEVPLGIKARKWKKQAAITRKILTMIDYNKQ